MFDGEGEVAWPVFLQKLFAMLDKEDGSSDEEDILLLAYTFHESTQR